MSVGVFLWIQSRPYPKVKLAHLI